MKRKKLAMVIGTFYPAQAGGPDNTIYWQAKALSKKGVDVTVATTMCEITKELQKKYNIKPNIQTEIDGVKVIYFNCFQRSYISAVFKWVFHNTTDDMLVNLTSYFAPISWISAMILVFNKKSFFLAPRGELENNALIYNKTLKKIMMKLFLKRLYDKAEFVLVTSKQELEFSKKFFRPDMEFKILPNYIEVKNNLKHIDAKQKRDILYLGRLHPKKGIENLIEAYAMLDERLKKDHYLKIAGSGSTKYINFLKEIVRRCYLEEYVQFLGHKEREEKEDLYKTSKLFVLPSYSENFGNVVLESLMHKTPVITSKYTPWQDLEKYKCGFWIDNKPHDIKRYIELILKMDEKEYKQLSENAFKFVNEHYNIENNIENFIHIINDNKKE